MNRLAIRWLVFLSFGVPMTAGAEDDIDLAIRQQLGGFTQDNQDLSWVTDELRPVVVGKLMDDWSRSDGDQRREVERKLVSLGHPETLQRLAGELQTGNQWNALEWSATEDSIPYLMETMASGSKSEPGFGDGDVHVSSGRCRAAGIVVEVVRSRNVFPEETRRWAATLEVGFESPGIEDRIRSLVAWWDNNRRAISEKRLSEAAWLPPINERPQGYLPGESGNPEENVKRGSDIVDAALDGDKTRDQLMSGKSIPLPILGRWEVLLIPIFLAPLLGWAAYRIQKRKR